MATVDELATKVDAYEDVDGGKVFQRKARVLQSIWRIEKGYPIGNYLGRLLGSTLPMPWAQQTLANFLTEDIREVVKKELDPERSKGKLYGKPRIFNNLLSSQPMAFNLFAILSRNASLATRVFRELTAGRCQEVTGMQFEHSPGRRNPKYLNDRSAFDFYVEYTGKMGPGFIGIEVKYHEDLKDEDSTKEKRGKNLCYGQVSDKAECFVSANREKLEEGRLRQIWRDHLLSCSILQADKDKFQDGFFVFLSPKDNVACNEAIVEYRSCLSCTETFQHWTLESVVETIRKFTREPWIAAFQDRYTNFAKVDRLLSA